MNEMIFTDLQRDAIIELINMGIGRAADALAQIISEEVILSVPNIEFINYESVGDRLKNIDSDKPSVVLQHFKGDFSGNALLIFPDSSGKSLVSQMLKQTVSEDEISDLEEEALSEIGNIILNACFGQLADLLSAKLDGEVPIYLRTDIEGVLKNSEKGVNQADVTLVMLLQVDFELSSSKTKGYVVFIMDVASLENFKAKVESYLKALFN